MTDKATGLILIIISALWAAFVISRMEFNYPPSSADYYETIAKHPSAACHLAGGTWKFTGNRTDFSFDGSSENIYTCTMRHPWQQDWTLSQ